MQKVIQGAQNRARQTQAAIDRNAASDVAGHTDVNAAAQAGVLKTAAGANALFATVALHLLAKERAAMEEMTARLRTMLASPPSGEIRQLSGDSFFQYLLEADGRPRCWGEGPGNQPPADIRFQSLSFGSYCICGVTVDGGVYCWGQDLDGECKPVLR